MVSSPNPWKISLFGELTVHRPSGESITLTSRKAAELLAFLAIRRNAVVSRDTIAAALWPDSDLTIGRNRLKQTLAVLRKEVEGIPIVVQGKHGVELDRESLEIDYHLVEQKLKWIRALPGVKRSQAALRISSTLQQGFLPGVVAVWAEGERRRMEGLLDDLRRQAGEAKALAQIEFHFGDDLDGAPIPILGRERELLKIRTWLRERPERILRLIGPPGIGKTRLLQEILDTCGYLCDATLSLSARRHEAAQWMDQSAQTLGIGGNDVESELIQLLKSFEKPLLLIDEWDRASVETIRWAENLVQLSPNLRLISTSTLGDLSGSILEIGPLSEEGPAFLRASAEASGAEYDARPNFEALRQVDSMLETWPRLLRFAGSWLALMDGPTLLSKLEQDPDAILHEAALGQLSMVERVNEVLQARPENLESALALSICQGVGPELAEGLIGSNWPGHVKGLLATGLVTGRRFVMPWPVARAVQIIAGTKAVSAARERLREVCQSQAAVAAKQIGSGDRRRGLSWLNAEWPNLQFNLDDSIKGQLAEGLDALGIETHVISPEAIPPESLVGRTFRREAIAATKERRWFDAGALAERAAVSAKKLGERKTLFEALAVLALALWGQSDQDQVQTVLTEIEELQIPNSEARTKKMKLFLQAEGASSDHSIFLEDL